jgi:molybdopterin-guanine dinucleotide biosynthesis protein A
MPRVGEAVRALFDALPGAGADGVMAASSDGRLQPLAGFYSTAALERAVQDAAARNALVHGSVFALLASLDVQAVVVPAGSTDDVDTWDDAAALGVAVREQ